MNNSLSLPLKRVRFDFINGQNLKFHSGDRYSTRKYIAKFQIRANFICSNFKK